MPPAVNSAKTTNGTWSSTFPPDQETLADSTLFMKRLLYITFSQIISSRDLCGSNCFKKRRCDNIRLYVFNTIIPEAYDIADQLRAVCETIEKGYFRELHLNIMNEDGKKDEVIEVYKMGVSYGDDKSAPSITLSSNEMSRVEVAYKGKEALREQTRDLLVRLHQITSKLADLPDNHKWSFYILYDDEKTPKGYQARGFNRRPEPYSMNPDAQRIVVGDASANHHVAHFEVSSVYIEDPVEFEELISGDFSAIQESMRSDSRDSSIDATTPTKQGRLNDTFEELPPREVAETPKESKRRGRGSSGFADLENAAQNLQIEDKGNGISASSPEERQPHKSQSPPKKSPPNKVLRASKAIKKTPGDVGTRQAKKKGRM